LEFLILRELLSQRLGWKLSLVILNVSKKRLEFPPAVTTAEKIADTIGGLSAFIVRLAITMRLFGPLIGKAPKAWRQPIVWEIEGQASGAPPGEGAAMAMGLQAVGAIPLPGTKLLALLTKFGKTSTVSAGFAGLAAAQGADEVDIYINAAIPWAFGGWSCDKESICDPDAKGFDAKGSGKSNY